MKFLLVALLFLFGIPTRNLTVVEADPTQIVMRWKTSNSAPIKTFSHLFLLDKRLTFATNGGMYAADLQHSPVGLYVENGQKLKPLRKVNNPKVNFGMQPQGVFLITKDNKAHVVDVNNPLVHSTNLKYATQSSPILVTNGKVNPKLTKSKSATIRNGVGVKANGKVVLLVARDAVTFQEFAQLFIQQGCTSAMYLDGNISNGLSRQEQMFDGCECYGPFIGVTK
jgi:uncharacterized protein YigE (DUF2233 family)